MTELFSTTAACQFATSTSRSVMKRAASEINESDERAAINVPRHPVAYIRPHRRKPEYLAKSAMRLLQKKGRNLRCRFVSARIRARFLLNAGRLLPSRSHKTLLRPARLLSRTGVYIIISRIRPAANEMESARSVNDIRKHARDDVTTNGSRSTAPAESSFTFIR